MQDLEKLTPAERANQLGKPDGEIGIAIGEALNRTNGQVISAVYQCLQLADQMHVLEIGFANGHTVTALLAYAKELRYTGIDISETMVAEAIRFNESLVAARRAAFHLSSADAMPLPDASVDRVAAVNVIYFLPDPIPALREIRRVLRPSGFSVIASVDPESVQSMSWAKPEFGFYARDGATLAALHREAGFREPEIRPYEEITTRPDGTFWSRRFSFVVAAP